LPHDHGAAQISQDEVTQTAAKRDPLFQNKEAVTLAVPRTFALSRTNKVQRLQNQQAVPRRNYKNLSPMA
jgi:Arc/MetJ family transcription regulator